MTTDFSEMTTPALMVAGDKDASAHLTVRGPDWHTDPYLLSPGPGCGLAQDSGQVGDLRLELLLPGRGTRAARSQRLP